MQISFAGEEEWSLAWKKSRTATYYQSPDWYRIWARYFGPPAEIRVSRLLFNDGQTAIVPFLRTPTFKGLRTFSFSSPVGTYGGWVSENLLKDENQTLLLHYLASQSDIVVRLCPFEFNIRNIGGLDVRFDITHVVRLTGRNIESLVARWDYSQRKQLRQATENHLRVVRATNDSQWEDYFRIYQRSLTRWGSSATSRYSFKLFEHLRTLPNEAAVLWLAYDAHELAAGGLCFYSSSHCGYWHQVADERFFRKRPIQLLIYEMLRDALARGLDWFDFNPSGGHQSVARFKDDFGTECLVAPLLTREGRISKFLSCLKELS